MNYFVEHFRSYHDILHCETPRAWLDKAANTLDILLLDHANCEKKAAGNAIKIMFHYPDSIELNKKMSQLAREELAHYTQVLTLMEKRGIAHRYLNASKYAKYLQESMQKQEPHKKIDTLLINAIIEARSCERFACLTPVLNPIDYDLAQYYKKLYQAEARHIGDYLALAEPEASPEILYNRLHFFAEKEAQYITQQDPLFRFHSGVPIT